ncbi:MAG TPA: ADP-polyphosphate phosphotransferase [Terriglobia bacterium]|nr:ADP-polyphosphate phosphotransferase [Terriglobia bacterium]
MKHGKYDSRVRPGMKVRLDRWPTKVKPLFSSKRHYERMLEAHTQKLSELQDILYAHNRYALLLIFQAMDAAGKDGAIKHVMSGVNPQGCQVFSFKHPSAEELDHDFLWRTTRSLPERGRIGIFNRSYYEEVLIVRVHPEILEAENLPAEVAGDKDLWENRYRSITDMERHLFRNGTRILKFFLHISRQEQKRRFLKRIDDPTKNWKFSQADLAERERWDDYMEAYEACLGATSADHAPWHVIPADDKKNARLMISSVILDALESLKLEYPRLDRAQTDQLQKLRVTLEKER